MIKVKKRLVGVNTHRANKIVELMDLKINSFKENLKNKKYQIRSLFYHKETRFDFLVNKNNKKIFIEVKNVTLSKNNKESEFPDAPHI